MTGFHKLKRQMKLVAHLLTWGAKTKGDGSRGKKWEFSGQYSRPTNKYWEFVL